jgi:RNA polymerase sigma-70 factor (ECF subfamily)
MSPLGTTQAATEFAREETIDLERALVERARAGDARAFRSLFERHGPSVRRFLGDLLRDDAAAEEAMQETFVRAHKRLASLRAEDRLRPWLFGIARHVFHEALRARRRVAELPRDHDEIDRAASPEAVLIGQEADGKLREALGHLAPERRAALVLRIDHGLDYDEIRTVMGWTLAKVKNEIHRARLELRERLGGYLE